MGLEVKKGSIFYIVAIALLGVASISTDDGDIVLLNQLVMMGLKAVFVLDNVFDTRKWQFQKYISTIVTTGFMAIGEIIKPFEDTYEYFLSRKGSEIYPLIKIIIYKRSLENGKQQKNNGQNCRALQDSRLYLPR